MRRREFIGIVGGAAAAWPMVARAQQSDRVRLVGVLAGFREDDPEAQALISAFRQRLQELGWSDGRNVRFEERLIAGDPNRRQAAAVELVKMAPDVILVNGGRGVADLRKETREIPIVFAIVADPVGEGFVESLARPGGNITGVTQFEFMGDKLLEMLKEIAPRVTRIAFAYSSTLVGGAERFKMLEASASSFAVKPVALPVDDPSSMPQLFKTFAQEPDGGVIVAGDSILLTNRNLIVEQVARYQLPTIYGNQSFVADGGLMSYGVDRIDQYRQAATYVDRILRGAKPADLPVQRPVKFYLSINIKTAKALGLNVPQTLLVAADEVIE